MARRGMNGNGAATINEQPTEQQIQVAPEAERAPEETQHGAPVGETTGTEAPAEEPGPRDFKRHSGARLVSDHEANLALRRELDDLIEAREEEIGSRLRARGKHATIRIAGSEYVARQKPGGKMGIAKVGPRVETSLDG